MSFSRIGIRVFPSETSERILRSPALLHFSPTPEPPIDYTIKEKKRPDYSVAHDVFRRVPSPDFSREEDSLRNSPQRGGRARADRRSTQVVGEVLDGRRTTLAEETEKILNELNSTLEEAITPSRPIINPQRRRSIEQVKSLAEKGQRAQIAPILKTEVIEDLRQLARGKEVKSINENRVGMIEEMHEKTKRLVDEARNIYTPSYFLPQYADRPLPLWQKQLLAARASKETLRKYEERAWDEFDEWKKRCAPRIQLHPDYRYSSRPTLY